MIEGRELVGRTAAELMEYLEELEVDATVHTVGIVALVETEEYTSPRMRFSTQYRHEQVGLVVLALDDLRREDDEEPS